MSEHSDHWRSELAHAFKKLREADDQEARRLEENREAARKLLETKLDVVLNQAKVDAERAGYHATVTTPSPEQRNYVLKSDRTKKEVLTVSFQVVATPESIQLIASRIGGLRIDLLKNKNPHELQESEISKFLETQIQAVTPKE